MVIELSTIVTLKRLDRAPELILNIGREVKIFAENFAFMHERVSPNMVRELIKKNYIEFYSSKNRNWRCPNIRVDNFKRLKKIEIVEKNGRQTCLPT